MTEFDQAQFSGWQLETAAQRWRAEAEARGRGAIVFFDTETTGLDPDYDWIWEVAYSRREIDGTEVSDSWFVEHNRLRAEALPEPFLTQYKERFRPERAIPQAEMARRVGLLFTGRAHMVGANPTFDAGMLANPLKRIGARPGWHYHLQDVEAMCVGWLKARARFDHRQPQAHRAAIYELSSTLPQKSDDLFRAVGVDPEKYKRHTAMGDVSLVRDVWDALDADR